MYIVYSNLFAWGGTYYIFSGILGKIRVLWMLPFFCPVVTQNKLSVIGNKLGIYNRYTPMTKNAHLLRSCQLIINGRICSLSKKSVQNWQKNTVLFRKLTYTLGTGVRTIKFNWIQQMWMLTWKKAKECLSVLLVNPDPLKSDSYI